ncbi:hypothetical protein ABIF97_001011 [Bradyrhizobium japonicum]
MLRIKGILALDQGGPEALVLAEAHFNHTLEWSRRQGATSWELRTATSLACLMQKQSRFGEARELLAPLYARFSEGFATADLVKARSLLTLLNESTPCWINRIAGGAFIRRRASACRNHTIPLSDDGPFTPSTQHLVHRTREPCSISGKCEGRGFK